MERKSNTDLLGNQANSWTFAINRRQKVQVKLSAYNKKAWQKTDIQRITD